MKVENILITKLLDYFQENSINQGTGWSTSLDTSEQICSLVALQALSQQVQGKHFL